VQEGRSPEDSKPLKGKAAGAIQLSEDHDGNTYRSVYTVELEDTVYVLHCFQKKSTRGIATPKPDLDRIERRLKDARTLHASRKGNRS
jgi:phage-related protein